MENKLTENSLKTNSAYPAQDLRGSTITDKFFSMINLSRACLQKSDIIRSAFHSCNFNNASLNDIKLQYCTIHDSNLDAARFMCADFSGSKFYRVSMIKAWGDHANFDNARLSDVDFYSADLHRSSFVGANCEGSSFIRANLKGCDFTDANLKDVDFYQAEMHNAKFNKDALATANLLDAHKHMINLID